MLDLGRRIGGLLDAGSFVALYGQLGAGKSVLARGIALALGIDNILSPTFTIVKTYPSTPVLHHFDAYRLGGSDELYAMGYEDYTDGIILMEWANIVLDALPNDRLEVEIIGSGNDSRTVKMIAHTNHWQEVLLKL